MSILWGQLKQRDAQVQQQDLEAMSARLQRYATGDRSLYVNGRLGMGILPYHSHERSLRETGPLVDNRGDVLSFDGRLDNHREIASWLGMDGEQQSDSAIVLAAFERWGEESFAHLTGDWSIALWSESEQYLYLARDHAGARTLYFLQDGTDILWSTYLEPLVRGDESLSEEYVARYLSAAPIRSLTPYQKLHSVLPGHYVRIDGVQLLSKRHWTAVVKQTVRYRHDEEYDEHFLELFERAVSRRTGEGAPVLAQLSGGMDSTAIVCMSDWMRRKADPDAALLDTVSFFDDSEASLDEKRYFTETESFRGKAGTHLDMAYAQRTLQPHDPAAGQYLIPGADSFSLPQEERFVEQVWRHGYRSILSGIGGDEVLGGVPIGLPELGDYFVTLRAARLCKQAVAWSLVDRTPLLLTLKRCAEYSLKAYGRQGQFRAAPPWLTPRLKELRGTVTPASPQQLIPRTALPSKIDNAASWWSIMETLPHQFPQLLHRAEYRYPFLDKHLVEYLFSIPRPQILRPGRRRYLMRRALKGIVPEHILERRRKAFQLRGPLSVLREKQEELKSLLCSSEIVARGWVDPDRLVETLDHIAQGNAAFWQVFMRATVMELWLRSRRENETQMCGQMSPAEMSLTA